MPRGANVNVAQTWNVLSHGVAGVPKVSVPKSRGTPPEQKHRDSYWWRQIFLNLFSGAALIEAHFLDLKASNYSRYLILVLYVHLLKALRTVPHSKCFINMCYIFTIFLCDHEPLFFILFLEKEEGMEKGRDMMCKRNIDQLPPAHPWVGTWPQAQACALTGNRTGDLCFTGQCSIHWATPARATVNLFK